MFLYFPFQSLSINSQAEKVLQLCKDSILFQYITFKPEIEFISEGHLRVLGIFWHRNVSFSQKIDNFCKNAQPLQGLRCIFQFHT